MVRVIPTARLIPAAGSPPKKIAEYIGREVSKTTPVSIAMMKSPPGWSEPGQRPEFDEYSIVISGTLIISTQAGDISVESGQAAIVTSGEWVRYSSPHGAEYFAICLPAFSPDLAHRDDDTESTIIEDTEKNQNIIYEESGKEGLILIEELWNQLREHHICHARYLWKQLQMKNFSERRDEILKMNEGREILTHLARVENTGKLIGFCVSSAATGDYGEIESLFVSPEYRFRGIGSTLMNRACSWLNEMNTNENRVGICEGNEDAFKFYERFGFYLRRHILLKEAKE